MYSSAVSLDEHVSAKISVVIHNNCCGGKSGIPDFSLARYAADVAKVTWCGATIVLHLRASIARRIVCSSLIWHSRLAQVLYG